jgi:hypothetical protein
MPYKQTKSSATINTTDNIKGTKTSITRSRSTKTKQTRGQVAGGLLTTIGQLNMIAITILVIGVGSSVNQFTTSDLQQTNPNYKQTNTYIPYDDPLNNINYIQYGEGVFNRFFGPDSFTALLSKSVDTANNVLTCLSDLPECFFTNQLLKEQYDDEIQNPISGTFIDTFGSARFYELSLRASSSAATSLTTSVLTPYGIYLQMTTSERTFIRDYTGTYMDVEKTLFVNYTPLLFYLFGFTNPFTNQYQWGFYTWPNIVDTVSILGV